MISLQRTVQTATPARAVFEYLADFTTAQHWDPSAIRVTRIAGDGQVGSEYEVVSKFAGAQTELVYRLTDLESPTLIRLRGEKKAVTAVDTITVTSTPAGTEVTYAVEFDFHGFFRVLEPLLTIAVRRLLREGAEGLRTALNELG
ncbi:hypothetical protein GOHSU_29_00320 [Gordonia hirsuta DSM 44140 = NBRC 16056]|uniref:Polyketide cyclase/dehydrase n=1 Tax=Gordonia hirsuta DSM 44140 = NBRC 16056 TaxID=1121927 RepID=L7LAX4_9ACTN|nr:SRPBCC family protein [Gordonia hirsuta]GAC58049.1 hypothetical protein GOHSU_29_00320 [Gordonia hirsuta DSM 44140 = NBRC 16056]